MRNEAMYALSLSHAPLTLQDAFPFSCHGCGHLCCGNLATPILIMPPEYLRLQWHLQRHADIKERLSKRQLFTYQLDHISGLPMLKLAFQPFLFEGKTLSACPFVLHEDCYDDPCLIICAVHPARPHTCRLFPLGMTIDGWYGRAPTRTSYYIMSYCPGFEIPAEGETTIAGYQPPRHDFTVADWLAGQMDAQLHEEILFHFFEVVTYYHSRGWHLPTKEHRLGTLTESTYSELAGVWYHVPEPPANPEDDHRFIMSRLRYLRDDAEAIIRGAIERSRLTFLP